MSTTATVLLRKSVRNTDIEYTYIVPEDLEGQILVGQLVDVPFGKGNTLVKGIVTSLTKDSCADTSKLKRINSIIDKVCVMNEDQMKLVAFMKTNYVCTSGDAISLMVPSTVADHKNKKVRVASIKNRDEVMKALEGNSIRSNLQINILSLLLDKDYYLVSSLLADSGASNTQLTALKNKGLINVNLVEDESETATINKDNQNINEKFTIEHQLNLEQQNAVDKITAKSDKARTFLLHGITGSGKTEVYLSSANAFLERGESVLYLVPEISLTPQTINWLRGRFSECIAILHSRLTDKERYIEWDKIRRGKARIVVGARSAIFAPIHNLKLIIIDEEHDSSYRSEKHPNYSTRTVALARARYTGATVVLGSATPSIETYYAAQNGYYELIELKNRANPNARLPKVNIIDMKQQVKLGFGEIISKPLMDKMKEQLSLDKQVILFLNRRGLKRNLICNDCGESLFCPSCSVAMTMHRGRFSSEKNMICHYCGHIAPLSEVKCTCCGSSKFTSIGFGTEQLEDFLKKTLPAYKVLRMDQDTTIGQGAHERILEAFREHEASILIGTQMIAKGHDFPDVTVVGIIDTDMMLSSPDFRASERAFQLITQSSGRAGRDINPGEVFIQTYKPNNIIIRHAAVQDYKSFYNAQIVYREDINLPPFKAIGELMISSSSEQDLEEKTQILYKYLRDFLSVQDISHGFELYGPMEAPIYELRERYRNIFKIKAKTKSALNQVFAQVIKDFDYKVFQLSFDADK